MPNEICKNAYKMNFYMKLHLKINKNKKVLFTLWLTENEKKHRQFDLRISSDLALFIINICNKILATKCFE